MSASSRAGMIATTAGQDSGAFDGSAPLAGGDRVVALAAKPEPSPGEQEIGPHGEGKEGDCGRDHLRAPCERNHAIASTRPSR